MQRCGDSRYVPDGAGSGSGWKPIQCLWVLINDTIDLINRPGQAVIHVYRSAAGSSILRARL